ncbi:MAG: purine-binding chemotaxis protein CheW [Deltaproteobacteria bacterium]|nr:purine-binding chemotaxis protein CheW [Deltaproteobacteria bacterium]
MNDHPKINGFPEIEDDASRKTNWRMLLGPNGVLSLATEETYLDAYARRGPIVESEQLLAFRLGREIYSLDLVTISEIRRSQDLTIIPKTKDFLLGVTAVRGGIVPIIDLRTRLGLDRMEITPKTRILVTSDQTIERGRIGILVDEVLGVVKIRSDAIDPPPATINANQAKFVHGLGRYESHVMVLLDTKAVVDYDAVAGRETSS